MFGRTPVPPMWHENRNPGELTLGNVAFLLTCNAHIKIFSFYGNNDPFKFISIISHQGSPLYKIATNTWPY